MLAVRLPSFDWLRLAKKPCDHIRNGNEEKKIKVKAPVMAKKNKQHQTSNCDISVTSAAAALEFLLCIDPDLPPVKFQLRGGTGYGDIDFKA